MLTLIVEDGSGEHAFCVRAIRDEKQIGYLSTYAPDSIAGRKSPCAGDVWIAAMLRAVKPATPLLRFVVCSSEVLWRGEGLGVELYVVAAHEAARRGGYLAASACVGGVATSEAARRVWRGRRLALRVQVFGLVAYADAR